MFDLYEFVKFCEQGIYFPAITIGFGIIHKRINNINFRKWSCTILGLIYMYIIFKEKIIYLLMCGILNITSICMFGPKYCQITTVCISLTYLTWYRVVHEVHDAGIHYATQLLLCGIVAKIIGLVYDIKNNEKSTSDDSTKSENDAHFKNPNFVDMFHFTFCHIGLVQGFFFRYRTYDDFIKLPFSKNACNYKNIMIRIPSVFLYYYLYTLLHSQLFPIKFILDDQFGSSPMWYKIIYITVQSICWSLQMAYSFMIAEMTCFTYGFGAYPAICDNVTGYGPTKSYKTQKLLSNDEVVNHEYDYKTVACAKYMTLLTSPWISECVKAWNLTYQYWLSSSIYLTTSSKTSSKKLGMYFTMFVGAIWHGIDLTFFITYAYITASIVASSYYWKISKYLRGWSLTLYLIVIKMICLMTTGFGITFFFMYTIDDMLLYIKIMNYLPITFIIIYYIFGMTMLSLVESNEKVNKSL